MSEREYQLASEYEGLLKVDTDLYYFIEDKMLSCRICHSCEQIIFTSLHLKPWGQPNFPLSSNSFFVWCWFSENVAKIIWPCRSLPPAEKSWICNWLCLLLSLKKVISFTMLTSGSQVARKLGTSRVRFLKINIVNRHHSIFWPLDAMLCCKFALSWQFSLLLKHPNKKWDKKEG